MEDHILSAAMKLSQGKHLETTMSSLYEAIKASEHLLTSDLEASKWFDLSVPTDLLNSPSAYPSLAAAINQANSHNSLKRLVGNKNTGGLVTPPYSPKAFASAPAPPRSPCKKPPLLGLSHLTLNEDVPMAEETDMQTETQTQIEQNRECEAPEEGRAQLNNSDGDGDGRGEVHVADGDGDSRGEGEDDDAMVAQEPQEAEVEEVEDFHAEDGDDDAMVAKEPQEADVEEVEDVEAEDRQELEDVRGGQVQGDTVNHRGTCLSNMHHPTG
jgi:hypothetical protein